MGLRRADPSCRASPLGATVGPDGTVYVGNYNTLDKVDRSQGALAFGEQTAGVTSTAMDASLYNGGNEPLTLSAITISGTGFALQTAATNNCTAGLVLQPGTLCNAAVTLTAPNAGTFSGTLAFKSNSLNATTTQNVALSGLVYGVYVTPAPDPLGFAPQTVNTTSGVQTVTLTNNGDLYSAGIGSPSSNNTAFTATLGTCTTSIAVGSSCALSVTFNPALAQPYSGTVSLSVSSSGGGPTQMVSFTVQGQGVAVSTPDAGSDASTGITDAAADVAETSVTTDAATVDAAGPADATPDTSTEPTEASTDAGTEPVEASMEAAAPDSATGEMDAAVAQDATTGSDGAVEDAEPGADAEFTADGNADAAVAGSAGEKPGCSCRAAGAHQDAALWPLGALVAMFTLRRRRRAARSR